MRAAAIFALARTMRCASVGVAIRNAPAIASVVRPQTSRSVRAMRASSERLGWQQVKTRRSRSSSIASRASQRASQPGASSATASTCSAASSRATKRRSAAQAVDGAEAPGRDQPRGRVGRHPVGRPLLRGSDEGVVQRVLREVEAAEQAHQGREDAAALLAVDRGDAVLHGGGA
jgi:hypothetical protein